MTPLTLCPPPVQEDDFEEEEDHILGVEDLQKLQRRGSKLDPSEGGSKPEVIMESTTDAAEWKLEVERVLPQLKVTIRADNKVSPRSRSS